MRKTAQSGFAHLILLGLIAAVVVGVLTGTAFYYSKQSKNPVPSLPFLPKASPSSQSNSSDNCGPQCQAQIDLKINGLKTELIQLIKNNGSSSPASSIATPVPSTTAATNTPKEAYVYFGVNGSLNVNDWTDVAGTQVNFN